MTASRSLARYASYSPLAISSLDRAEGERRSLFVFERESAQRTTESKSSLWETSCFTTAVTTKSPFPSRKKSLPPETCDRYHLKDVIVGKIYFLLVRIKIKHMGLSIIRRETTGSLPNQYNESETITKFEIMDEPGRRASARAKQSQFGHSLAGLTRRRHSAT
ncbi:vacuolar protein sorting-associated protein 26-domain-containing protein [Lactarius akahatsu]|uniref:Vacuolar protein sorting-associated protein 26-domain-containing protein n=1 Tax=Lactarius akahatsu TaxID=416441 RepID=A0AAD4L7Z6_9AGAM|nr:vacuolar protein sorting-associated protein 26-domain-containing protein [Lactarius akahatsu]